MNGLENEYFLKLGEVVFEFKDWNNGWKIYMNIVLKFIWVCVLGISVVVIGVRWEVYDEYEYGCFF